VTRLLSDERLATMAGSGSDSAFAMLYRRFDGPLHGYCLSIVKNPEDARDVLQSAWMKALVALRSQSRRAPVRPWLFRIVHNEAIDTIRRRRGEQPLLESHQPAAGAPAADEEVEGRERVAEVVADLRALPEGQRAALVMREWADFEYGEIALALATSEGNARQLVFTARCGLEESRAGRNQSCDAIRLELAGADGRRLRNRRIRSHLDSCEACRAFSSETRDRRRAAAAALLPWTPAAAPDLLCGLVGGGATASGMAGGSALLGGLAKGAAVAAIVTGGVGGAELAAEKTLRTGDAGRAEVVEVREPGRRAAVAPAVKAPAQAAVRIASGGSRASKARPPLGAAVTKEPGRRAAASVTEDAPGSDAGPRPARDERGGRRRRGEREYAADGGRRDGPRRSDRRAAAADPGRAPYDGGGDGGYRSGDGGYRDSHTDFLRRPDGSHTSG
jgi:RNA polymerase sigma factor (sigma-70 family)